MEIININEQKCYENYVFPLTYEYKYDKKVAGSLLNTNSSSSYTNITGSIDSYNNDEIHKLIDWLSNNNKAIDDQLLLHKAILFRLAPLSIYPTLNSNDKIFILMLTICV
jgi:hypothetical protein